MEWGTLSAGRKRPRDKTHGWPAGSWHSAPKAGQRAWTVPNRNAVGQGSVLFLSKRPSTQSPPPKGALRGRGCTLQNTLNLKTNEKLVPGRFSFWTLLWNNRIPPCTCWSRFSVWGEEQAMEPGFGRGLEGSEAARGRRTPRPSVSGAPHSGRPSLQSKDRQCSRQVATVHLRA